MHFYSKNRSSRGFTLIELLVVIAIIGILSSVVLASLNGARRKGRDARRISDLKQMQLALEMYYDANGSEYPDAATSLAPTYISVLPEDPQDVAYQYGNLESDGATACAISGAPKCVSYVLGATLEDENNAALGQDIDGTVGGITCTDPTYCVQP